MAKLRNLVQKSFKNLENSEYFRRYPKKSEHLRIGFYFFITLFEEILNNKLHLFPYLNDEIVLCSICWAHLSNFVL